MNAPEISPPVIFIALLGGSAAAFANLLFYIMIGKANERLPPTERISYLWWGSGVRAKFRQLYPGNSLLPLQNLCLLIMILCFIALVRLWVFS